MEPISVESLLTRRLELLRSSKTDARKSHFVQFYESDRFLQDTVSLFISSGLQNNEAAVLIATPEHTEIFLKALASRSHDIAKLTQESQLVVLDARKMLESFLVNGLPDRKKFEEKVGALVKELFTRFGKLRAYGEMVDLYWNDGSYEGTIQLENLWNDLVVKIPISLLCGYQLKSFHEGSERFPHICQSHTHAFPTEEFFEQTSADARLREIVYLQHQAERLQSTEAFKDLVLENSRDCIKLLDLESRIIFMNRGGLDSLGLSSLSEILDVPWLDFWDGEQRIDATLVFEKAKAGRPLEFTGSLFCTRSKTHRWWHVALSPTRNEKGEVNSILAISREVTAQKKLELELRSRVLELKHSRDELDVILHGVTDGITVLDPQGKFIYANNVAAKLCGYDSVDEFLNASTAEVMSQFELFDENDNPLPTDGLPARRALHGIQNIPEMLLKFRIKKSGEIRWSIVSATPVFDEKGRVRYAISIFRDFTDRKIAEQSLKILAGSGALLCTSLEYEDTLQSIAKITVPSLADWCTIYVKEPGTLTPRSVAIAHIDPAKIKWAEELQKKYPPDWDRLQGIGNVIRTGKAELYTEIPDHLLEGIAQNEIHLKIIRELRIRSAIIVPLKARNWVLGAMTLISAESGRRYTENDLRIAEDLAYRAGMAVENALLYKKAQQSIEARNEFLSIASHELKTPITSLKMQLEMAQRRLKLDGMSPSTEKLAKAFDISCRQVERLTSLVEDMLDVSRIQAGKMSLRPSATNLSEIVKEVCERFQDQFADTQGQLHVDISDDVTGHWDRNRIEQVVVNLLSNALKYAPGTRVEVSTRQAAGVARLIVQDHGPGIPIEKQNTIFERFERATSARNITGLGLGLFIAKQIVESHKGAIQVESSAGQGARFIVEVPLKPNYKSEMTL